MHPLVRQLTPHLLFLRARQSKTANGWSVRLQCVRTVESMRMFIWLRPESSRNKLDGIKQSMRHGAWLTPEIVRRTTKVRHRRPITKQTPKTTMNSETPNDTQNTDDKAVDLPRLVRLTWRKGARRSGMMRLPETYTLYRGCEKLATCQRLHSGDWFWYGGGKNTSSMPTDLETAKRDAKAHILENSQNQPHQSAD